MRVFLIFLLGVYAAAEKSTAQHIARPLRLHRMASQESPVRPAGLNGPVTVRVLALRVQFKQEDPDNPSTTGNGHFDLGSAPIDRTLDLPPHNKSYFEDQLLAMRNYFLNVSDSNLIIEYTVKPDGPDDAITLDTFMGYYGILGTPDQRDIRLAEFFHDGITKADAGGSIDFSLFDHVIIFHAGVGQDFSNEDNTPNDLSSRFVSLGLLRQRYGQEYAGVPVTGGLVDGGVVVPETESQTLIDPIFGIDVFTEIGLTGILCANFGSALGMPDLFNTETGQPGIGVFGLEDQGAVNGDGLIPAEPDPWTKIYMGWTRPILITDSIHVEVAPKQRAGHSVIFKVPINSSEYFLIENKQRDLIPNDLSPAVLSRIDTINNGDGTITVDTVYFAGVTRSAGTGVITRVDEYDNALPGRGLLIWHIDENLIRQRLPTNSINNDLNRRGVRVVEASGSQDIGYFFSAGPFSSVDAGNRFDFYFHGNDAFAFYNNDIDSVFLTPHSVPNTMANDRSYSGIHLTGVSSLQDTMSFDLRSSALKRGYPAFAGSRIGTNALAAGRLISGAGQQMVACGTSGEVFAWQWNGQPVIPGSETRMAYGLGGDSTIMPVALFAMAGDSVYAAPALGDMDDDGLAEVIVGDIGGQLYVWRARDDNSDERADTMFTRNLNASITTSPVVLSGPRIAVGCADGTVHVFESSGLQVISLQRESAVTGLSAIGTDSLVVTTSDEMGILRLSNGSYSVVETQDFAAASTASGDLEQSGDVCLVALQDQDAMAFLNPPPGWPISLSHTVRSSPSIADIDQDGFLEVLFGSDHAVLAFNHNGTLAPNFPIFADRTNPSGPIVASVLVADADGDAAVDVIAAASNGKVYAWNSSGTLLDGFPLTTGSTVAATPVVIDLEGDGHLDLAAMSDNGFLYAWELPGRNNSGSVQWGQWAKNAARIAYTTEYNTITAPSGSLMPKSKVYNYPNPARGSTTTIRYYLSEAATVKIRIFDMAGDHVVTLTGTGVPQSENEVVWNLNRIQSGIYFAKIEARNVSGHSVTRTVKIAVTK